jgi:hypothetical protein
MLLDETEFGRFSNPIYFMKVAIFNVIFFDNSLKKSKLADKLLKFNLILSLLYNNVWYVRLFCTVAYLFSAFILYPESAGIIMSKICANHRLLCVLEERNCLNNRLKYHFSKHKTIIFKEFLLKLKVSNFKNNFHVSSCFGVKMSEKFWNMYFIGVQLDVSRDTVFDAYRSCRSYTFDILNHLHSRQGYIKDQKKFTNLMNDLLIVKNIKSYKQLASSHNITYTKFKKIYTFIWLNSNLLTRERFCTQLKSKVKELDRGKVFSKSIIKRFHKVVCQTEEVKKEMEVITTETKFEETSLEMIQTVILHNNKNKNNKKTSKPDFEQKLRPMVISTKATKENLPLIFSLIRNSNLRNRRRNINIQKFAIEEEKKIKIIKAKLVEMKPKEIVDMKTLKNLKMVKENVKMDRVKSFIQEKRVTKKVSVIKKEAVKPNTFKRLSKKEKKELKLKEAKAKSEFHKSQRKILRDFLKDSENDYLREDYNFD